MAGELAFPRRHAKIGSMKFLHCPICQQRFEVALTTAMPFCSERCRSIDLGRWFDEEYGLPWEPTDPELLDDESEQAEHH